MKLFFLLFLATYGGMHALVFWGFHPLLKGHPALPSLTWIWMVGMIAAPLLVRLCDRSGLEALARGLAWVSYSWMGVVFIAFSLFTLVGLWELMVRLANRLLPQLPNLSLHGAVTATVVLFVVIAASFYGIYEANNLRIERIRIVTPRLPSGTAPIRIAQVSDLHLGLIHRDEALAPIVSRLQDLQPDLLVATGDIVDAQLNHLDELVELWQRIDPPLGKYAVTGNHEYYAGLDQALDFLRRSGFKVLRNRDMKVGEWLKVVGVDDPARRGIPDEDGALGERSELFTLLLKHRPDFVETSLGKFDLQLSGHAHRGQMFPFNLLTAIKHPRQNGLYPLASGQDLYVSRGTGTWGPPMRILSPPEITLFEIVPETP
ncbi:MAG: metallophosphoesterase [Desulfuromusa sp.]|jgi:predicted MPP superfamily phosphohydrolase|nr:metallophosphoesterase [Desulfuromusa sp.]